MIVCKLRIGHDLRSASQRVTARSKEVDSAEPWYAPIFVLGRRSTWWILEMAAFTATLPIVAVARPAA